VVGDAFAQYELICRGAQFSRIFESTREGIFILGADAAIRSSNPAFSRITGHAAADLAGLRLDFLLPTPAEPDAIAPLIDSATRDGNWNGELWLQRKSGEVFPTSMTLTTLRDGNARVTQYVGLCRDITERKQREMALLESEKRFRDFMEFAPIGMVIVALDGRLLKANQALCKILGFSREELESMNFESLAAPDDLAADLAMRRRLLEGEATVWQTEKRYLRKDGSSVWVQLTASLLRDTHGAPQCFDAQVEDISERRQHQDQIRQLAYFDALTGLPNRRLLQERLEQALADARRKGCMSAVIFLDLDHFKQVNDNHGHEIGDLLLKAAAQRLSACVRSGDTVARQGGDEFIIVLPDLKAAADAGPVAQKIVAALAAPYELTAAGLTIDVITTSVGLAVFPRDGVSAQDLMKHADAAMYAAKDGGRNGYRCYDATLADSEMRVPNV
ncbi:MAG TPA: diguanylate cyclase, partial [Rhodocyclaceae bacterium]